MVYGYYLINPLSDHEQSEYEELIGTSYMDEVLMFSDLYVVNQLSGHKSPDYEELIGASYMDEWVYDI